MDRENNKVIKNDKLLDKIRIIERELTLFSTGKFSSRKEARKLAKE